MPRAGKEARARRRAKQPYQWRKRPRETLTGKVLVQLWVTGGGTTHAHLQKAARRSRQQEGQGGKQQTRHAKKEKGVEQTGTTSEETHNSSSHQPQGLPCLLDGLGVLPEDKVAISGMDRVARAERSASIKNATRVKVAGCRTC